MSDGYRTASECGYCVFCKHSPHKKACPLYISAAEQQRRDEEKRADLRQEIQNSGDC